jgi:uncharacterized protein (TIGR00725 family)
MRYRQAVVIGSSDDETHLDEAREIGRFIARNGWVLISGGRGGVMEAASQGASEEQGIVIGIIPDTEHSSANKFCNIVIPTGIGYARNIINALSGDVIISISGGSGTLTEIAYAWQFGKPIIACAFTGGWSEEISRKDIDGRGGRLYRADTLEDVFRYLKEILH